MSLEVKLKIFDFTGTNFKKEKLTEKYLELVMRRI